MTVSTSIPGIGEFSETSHLWELAAFAAQSFRCRAISESRYLRKPATFWPSSELTYTLEASSRWTVMEARYFQDCIRVLLPLEIAQQWADSDQVSLSLNRAVNSGPSLLVEKDFQCLHSDESDPSDDADSFPNPSAGDQG